MANEVYANGRELSCKKADGKTICSFPDVCMTPPENPTTPPGVPIPYPNTGFAKDTTSGSKKVKISGKEVMLKNKSYYKKSVGDEAGSATKKGVITSVNRGKVYFNSWSMDVKIEGKNVTRHLDLTTHNHASQIGQTPPFPNQDGMILPPSSPICEEAQEKLADEADNLPGNMSRIHEDSVTRREVRRISDAYQGRSPPATTLAIGIVIGGSPGAQNVIPAHSRKTVGQAQRRTHYAKGASTPGKTSTAGKGCGTGKKFSYRKGQKDHRHAEAKIIEKWLSEGGNGQLVLNVSRPVCENCAKLIKFMNCGENGEQCNKVIVCDKNQSSESKDRLKC